MTQGKLLPTVRLILIHVGQARPRGDMAAVLILVFAAAIMFLVMVREGAPSTS